ncbi:unnamed protein product [Amoebophrya sp. A25]|nr:unnamed protein product [Amoebophrya sp. A25]|eukprot:GSA25T00010423001.1
MFYRCLKLSMLLLTTTSFFGSSFLVLCFQFSYALQF